VVFFADSAVDFDAVVFFAAVVFFDAAVSVFAAVDFAAVADFAVAAFLVPAAVVFFAVDFDAAVVLDPPVEVVPAVPSDFSVTVVDSLSTLGTCSPFASVETSPCIRTVLRPKSSGPRTVRGERIVRPSAMTGSTLNFLTLFPLCESAPPPLTDGLRTECRLPGDFSSAEAVDRPSRSDQNRVPRNAPSPSASGAGIPLTAADDELGQTVFGFELDRGARIVLRHRRPAQGPFEPGDDGIGVGSA
jgi:hypothetical protein